MPRAEELALGTGLLHRAARGLRRFGLRRFLAMTMRLRPIVIVPVALAAMPFSRVGVCAAARPPRGYVGR